MVIILNGEARPIEAGATVAQLLATLLLEPRKVAIERNREIVSRSRYPETELADGDVIEVVTFVGGG